MPRAVRRHTMSIMKMPSTTRLMMKRKSPALFVLGRKATSYLRQGDRALTGGAECARHGSLPARPCAHCATEGTGTRAPASLGDASCWRLELPEERKGGLRARQAERTG